MPRKKPAKRKTERMSKPVGIMLQGIHDDGLKERLVEYQKSFPYRISRTEILRRALSELLEREGY
jgi:hypothetical protein